MSLTGVAGAGLLAACLALPTARAQSTGSPNPPPNPAAANGAVAPSGASQSAAPATTPPPEKKHAKHVYTDDDFGSPSADDLPAGSIHANNMAAYYLPKDPMTAQQLASLQQYADAQAAYNRVQSIESIAKLYLRDDDVPFHGRDDWNRRAFDTWTDIWKAIDDFAQKLRAVRSQDSALLAQPQSSPRDIAQLQEQRIRLIQEWEPAEKAVNHFIALEDEAKQKAAEWRKYNSK
jgi:hypothetical protein